MPKLANQGIAVISYNFIATLVANHAQPCYWAHLHGFASYDGSLSHTEKSCCTSSQSRDTKPLLYDILVRLTCSQALTTSAVQSNSKKQLRNISSKHASFLITLLLTTTPEYTFVTVSLAKRVLCRCPKTYHYCSSTVTFAVSLKSEVA